MKNESENTEIKKENKHTVRHVVFSILAIIVCIILIPILVINLTMIIKSYTNSDEVPSFAGYLPMFVMTDSMYPEIESGDLIICHTIDAQELEQGDIIAFFDPASTSNAVVSHRIVNITSEDGILYFETKGDNNSISDSELVPEDNIVGKCIYVIPRAGNIAMFMQTTQGLIICIVCPLVILILYDVIRRRIYEKNKQKDTDMLLNELEELKKAAAEDGNNQGNRQGDKTEESNTSDKPDE